MQNSGYMVAPLSRRGKLKIIIPIFSGKIIFRICHYRKFDKIERKINGIFDRITVDPAGKSMKFTKVTDAVRRNIFAFSSPEIHSFQKGGIRNPEKTEKVVNNFAGGFC
jgi:hypothetical protein